MRPVVCLGGGPSLTQRDINACRGRAAVIAINSTYKKALWADVLYAADKAWWERHAFAPDFPGLKVTVEPKHRDADHHRLWVLRNTGVLGIETAHEGLRVGTNSGHQAINLAVHMGARCIVLLGYDMQPGPDGSHHHHDPHPGNQHPKYARAISTIETVLDPLRALGIDLINCTRSTALTAFPTARLEDVL